MFCNPFYWYYEFLRKLIYIGISTSANYTTKLSNLLQLIILVALRGKILRRVLYLTHRYGKTHSWGPWLLLNLLRFYFVASVAVVYALWYFLVFDPTSSYRVLVLLKTALPVGFGGRDEVSRRRIRYMHRADSQYKELFLPMLSTLPLSVHNRP